jgi:hypothetical protein
VEAAGIAPAALIHQAVLIIALQAMTEAPLGRRHKDRRQVEWLSANIETGLISMISRSVSLFLFCYVHVCLSIVFAPQLASHDQLIHVPYKKSVYPNKSSYTAVAGYPLCMSNENV